MHLRLPAVSTENSRLPVAPPSRPTQTSDSAPQIPKSGQTHSNTRIRKCRILRHLHTPVFCRFASHSFFRPCALLEKQGGYTPIVPKSELARSTCAYLRRSLGVASQRRWPLGGERRLSSRAATPAFFSCVTWCFDPIAAASRSSSWGAWPKQKTTDEFFSLASSLKK